MKSIFAGYSPDTQRKDVSLFANPQFSDKDRSLLSKGFLALYHNKIKIGSRKKATTIGLLADFISVILCPSSVGFDYRKRKGIAEYRGFISHLFQYNDSLFLSRTSNSIDLTVQYSWKHLDDLISILVEGHRPPPPKKGMGVDEGAMLVFNSEKQTILDESAPVINEILSLGSKTYTGNQLAKKLGFIADDASKFSGIKQITLSASPDSRCVFTVVFSIDKESCEYLCKAPFATIRFIDLYPMLSNWVSSEYEHTISSCISISRIASSIKEESFAYAKTNEYGLCLSVDGTITYIPPKVNNAFTYENNLLQAGTKQDGTFTLKGLQTAQINQVKNIPILVDWTNNMFSYTNTNGNIETIDISQYRKLQPSHVFNIFSRRGLDIKTLLKMAYALNVPTTVDQSTVNLGAIARNLQNAELTWADVPNPANATNIEEYVSIILRIISLLGDDKIYGGFPLKLVTKNDEYLAPLYKFVCDIVTAIEQDFTGFLNKYSVSALMGTYALLKAVSIYNTDPVKLESDANSERAAAIKQQVDPDWKQPSIPLMGDIGTLPHQTRVLNLMKDRPRLAILPIAAGGGKTVIAIADILYEFKNNTSAPYLVICPTHLVAQYVKEITFFTKGRLNCIPITSLIIRQSGFARLQKIFESAPRNTVVVCSYDVLKYKAVTVGYGTKEVTYYPVQDFLRQFQFGYCLMDESQTVRNAKSGRTKAVRSLVADIPKLRLASGTMAHNTITDLASQIGVLDPSIFGTPAEFNLRFGAETKKGGGAVKRWKPGAELAIYNTIKENMVVAKALRKEWAALLPPVKEQIHTVDLTPNQQKVYNVLLADVVDDIKNNAELMRKLDLIEKQSATKEDAEAQGVLAVGDDDSDDSDEANALAKMLNPYLQKLEIFTCAPGSTELGATTLKGSDLLSPKVSKILQIIKNHIDTKTPGKIIVFCQNTAVAEAIYAASILPQFNLQKSGILYKAATKTENGTEFEKNSKKLWMVGVENSMNTGLNLQFASRLIRAQFTWTPGSLEQGNARINRPQLKSSDKRDTIFFDWVVASRTIDMCKISRLISKLISISKFDNAGDPRYEQIPNLPAVPMSLKYIRKQITSDELIPYMEAYLDYNTITNEDYKEYKEKHKDELNADGKIKLTPFTHTAVPNDAKTMLKVPFVPGMDIYNAKDLGLVRLDEYLNLDSNLSSEDDEDDTDDNSIYDTLAGKPCWTELGSGIIKHCSDKMCTVYQNDDNSLVRLRNAQVFVVTKKETSTQEIQNSIIKSIGLQPATPVALPAMSKQRLQKQIKQEKQVQIKERKKIKEKQDEQLNELSVSLNVLVVNGMLGLRYTVDKDSSDFVKAALQNNGFVLSEPHYTTTPLNAKGTKDLLTALADKGYGIDRKYIKDLAPAWKALYSQMKKGQLKNSRVMFNDDDDVGRKQLIVDIATAVDLRTFNQLKIKNTSNPNAVKMFPEVLNGRVYAVLPINKNPASQKVRSIRVPNVTWVKADDTLDCLTLNIRKTVQVIKQLQEAGIQIINLTDVKAQLRAVKTVKFRDVDKETDTTREQSVQRIQKFHGTSPKRTTRRTNTKFFD